MIIDLTNEEDVRAYAKDVVEMLRDEGMTGSESAVILTLATVLLVEEGEVSPTTQSLLIERLEQADPQEENPSSE